MSPRRSRLGILNDDDDDPLTSAINLVDVFFVAMVILMIAAVENRADLSADTVTIIKNAGKPSMEIIVKDGQKTERFQASGASRKGNGTQAGIAYRMGDGTMVYVPQRSAGDSVVSPAGGPRKDPE